MSNIKVMNFHTCMTIAMYAPAAITMAPKPIIIGSRKASANPCSSISKTSVEKDKNSLSLYKFFVKIKLPSSAILSLKSGLEVVVANSWKVVLLTVVVLGVVVVLLVTGRVLIFMFIFPWGCEKGTNLFDSSLSCPLMLKNLKEKKSWKQSLLNQLSKNWFHEKKIRESKFP